MGDFKEYGQKTDWHEPYWDEGVPRRLLEGKRTKRYSKRVRHEKIIMARNRRRAYKSVIEQQRDD